MSAVKEALGKKHYERYRSRGATGRFFTAPVSELSREDLLAYIGWLGESRDWYREKVEHHFK